MNFSLASENLLSPKDFCATFRSEIPSKNLAFHLQTTPTKTDLSLSSFGFEMEKSKIKILSENY